MWNWLNKNEVQSPKVQSSKVQKKWGIGDKNMESWSNGVMGKKKT
jgi:hypothetical protein